MADTTRLQSFSWGPVNPSPGVTAWFAPAAPSAPTPPNIVTVVLPIGRVGVPYSAQLLADGDGPITWSLSPATPTLPAGLTLGASTGLLSGTPTAEWSTDIAFRAEGAAGPSLRDTQVMALSILGATDPVPDVPTDPTLPPPPAASRWVRLPRDAEVWVRIPRDPA